mmetsp:Transcript_15917/g.35848  ORF Transcript_15917/g.35848 Transcript_15917/m.35848 type:complete len:224 (+) Transcript_15917:579-1250(+)
MVLTKGLSLICTSAKVDAVAEKLLLIGGVGRTTVSLPTAQSSPVCSMGRLSSSTLLSEPMAFSLLSKDSFSSDSIKISLGEGTDCLLSTFKVKPSPCLAFTWGSLVILFSFSILDVDCVNIAWLLVESESSKTGTVPVVPFLIFPFDVPFSLPPAPPLPPPTRTPLFFFFLFFFFPPDFFSDGTLFPSPLVPFSPPSFPINPSKSSASVNPAFHSRLAASTYL